MFRDEWHRRNRNVFLGKKAFEQRSKGLERLDSRGLRVGYFR